MVTGFLTLYRLWIGIEVSSHVSQVGKASYLVRLSSTSKLKLSSTLQPSRRRNEWKIFRLYLFLLVLRSDHIKENGSF
jgi:hypothetical protein